MTKIRSHCAEYLESIETNLDMHSLYTNTDFSHDFEHKLDLIRFIIENNSE